MVAKTIVNGNVLMKDRQLLTLDEGEITAKSLVCAKEVWDRYETCVPTD